MTRMTREPLKKHHLEVLEDYGVFREEGAPPEIAALLCQAAAIHAQVTYGFTLDRIALAIYRDPAKAVSWIRQYEHIKDRLRQADDKYNQGDPDDVFEEALQAMRKELDK